MAGEYQFSTLKEQLGRLYLWGRGFEDGKLAYVLAQSDKLRDNVLGLLLGTSQLLIDIAGLRKLVDQSRIIAFNPVDKDFDDAACLAIDEDDDPERSSSTSAIRTVPATGIPFTVSEAARPFVLNVLDKFPLADSKLIERLGESNWQRYMTIRATMDQINKHTIFGKEPPRSVFTPYSVFHDSGMGTSMASASHYAASVASHTSFISSQAEEGNSTMRVPPTPPEVALNEPFECFICGHELFKIRNRVDWKWVNMQTRHGIVLNYQYRLHVFADLQPYICTFESCKSEMVKFPTRKLWSEHEFSEHRHSSILHYPFYPTIFDSSQGFEDHLSIGHAYSATSMPFHPILNTAEIKKVEPVEEQSCPLCKVILGKSRRDFAKHVGRHMETIALAALPRAFENDSDESSLDSVADNYTSVRLKNGLPEQGDSGCQDSDLPPKHCPDTLKSSLACLTETSPVEKSKERGRCPNPACNKFFKDLPAHMLTHQERPFKCPIVTCDYHHKGFVRKYDQSRHTLTHFKGTMVCGFCPGVGPAAEKSFNRADVFKRHLTSFHDVERILLLGKNVKSISKNPTGASGKCSICSAAFDGPQEFFEHLDECVLRFIQQDDTLHMKGQHLTPQGHVVMQQGMQEVSNSLQSWNEEEGNEYASTLGINNPVPSRPSEQHQQEKQKIPIQTTSYWSVPEQKDFMNLIAHYGKDWQAIADILKSKTPVMVSVADHILFCLLTQSDGRAKQVENYFHRTLENGDIDLERIAMAREDKAQQGVPMGDLSK
ncbi:MAG: hypothetical protein Q9187_004614 [Circinaria calcarea]